MQAVLSNERTPEQRLLGIARVVSVGVVLALIFSEVILDPVFIHPQKAVDDVVLGLLIGALFMLLGITGVEKLTGRRE